MSVNSQPGATVQCPSCGTQYQVAMQNIIDVDHSPRLKSLLLQGRLNVGVCPQCGTGGMLSAPLVYHDSTKELLFCLIPQELGLTEHDRQRTIGQLSNAIINSLPADQRSRMAEMTMRDRMLALRGVLRAHPGDCAAYIHITIPGESETILSVGGIRGVDATQGLQRDVLGALSMPLDRCSISLMYMLGSDY